MQLLRLYSLNDLLADSAVSAAFHYDIVLYKRKHFLYLFNVISDKGMHSCPMRSWCMIVRIQIKAKVVFDAPETEDNIEFQNEMNITKVFREDL